MKKTILFMLTATLFLTSCGSSELHSSNNHAQDLDVYAQSTYICFDEVGYDNCLESQQVEGQCDVEFWEYESSVPCNLVQLADQEQVDRKKANKDY